LKVQALDSQSLERKLSDIWNARTSNFDAAKMAEGLGWSFE
jgi:hypothetical protein